MPLYKRKPFNLVEPAPDLAPEELVFQVRFTKEIFRDYREYLNQINLYRQRVWTCKVTGKSNLTYEEALVSELRATEKVQNFPKGLMKPALHMIQFSTLRLKDLVYTISTRLQECFFEGEQLWGKKAQSVCPCKILKVLDASNGGSIQFEVGWLDKNKKVMGSSIEKADNLIRKKLPFSREMLKSFIRKSTSQSAPWVVHDKLALKHGVSTEPPKEIGEKDAENGTISRRKRTERDSENPEELTTIKKKAKTEEKPKAESVRYPIEDLLVQHGANDPVFSERPSSTRDFNVPMDCVGDLLMVWDFCSSFSRVLHLWPFSLEDFESAIVHKDSNINLIVESHSAVLRLLIKDEGEYFSVVHKKRRKSKITFMNWVEYLCDFLELEDVAVLSEHISIIRRGHYGLLDTHAKLSIYRQLVAHALITDAIREQLDDYIVQQTLEATKRLESRKMRKEHQQLNAAESDTMGRGTVTVLENGTNGDLNGFGNNCNYGQNRHASEGDNGVRILSNGKHGFTEEPSRMKEHKKVRRKKEDKEREDQEMKPIEDREHFDRDIEKQFIRTNPLGKDRNYNRYWFFRREGRVFVESSDSKKWGYYTTKEELDKLMGSFNPKGERERALQRQIDKYYRKICPVLHKRSKEIAHMIALEEAELRRSTRVRTKPKDSLVTGFRKYTNKWREN